MLSRKSRGWLVGLGVLLVLLGVVDAAGVVRARPALEQDLPGVKGTQVDGAAQPPLLVAGGFVPLQAQRGDIRVKQSEKMLDEETHFENELSEGVSHLLFEEPSLEPAETPRLIWIPAIDLYAPVTQVDLEVVEIEGVEYDQWAAPSERAAGWHASSALLGEAGNTVLNGHHNIYGEVFRDLEALQVGDEIVLYSDRAAYFYQVEERVIFPERFASLEQRLENVSWVLPTQDERLTLITCWPYESNTHRLVLVARPVARGE